MKKTDKSKFFKIKLKNFPNNQNKNKLQILIYQKASKFQKNNTFYIYKLSINSYNKSKKFKYSVNNSPNNNNSKVLCNNKQPKLLKKNNQNNFLIIAIHLPIKNKIKTKFKIKITQI